MTRFPALLLGAVLLCPPALAQNAILFLGDSLTEGYGIAAEKSYPSVLARALKQRGHDLKIINAGISGSTSASALRRLRWYLKSKPDILFLALGANDGLRGLSIQSLYSHLDQTIAVAKKAGMKVILAGMRLPPNYGEDYTRAFHQSFHTLAQAHDIAFIPFLLEGVAARPELNLDDGIHPNASGHEVMAKLVLPHIERALGGND